MAIKNKEIILAFAVAAASWVAAFAAIWSVQEQRHDAAVQRQEAKDVFNAQMGDELDRAFDSAEMRRARRDLAKDLLSKRPISDWRVLDFFDKVGAYLRLRRVDEETVYSSFSYYAERYWVASQGDITNFRKRESDNGYYGDFEDLNNEMLKIDSDDAEQPKSKIIPGPGEIQDFLQDEAVLPD